MPGIIRRTLGTADKVRESSTLHSPEQGWECFLEKDPGDVVLGEAETAAPRPPRRRRRKTTSVVAMNTSWEEEGIPDAKKLPTIPNDLLVRDENAQEGVGVEKSLLAPPPSANFSSVFSPSASGILGYLTKMTASISQIQDTLKELVPTNIVRSDMSPPARNEDLLLRMEALTTRFEASIQRHESAPPHHQQQQQQLHILDLQAQIQTLQKEAQDRNAIIVELQQSQEEERKESQERMAEVLQRLAQVQAEKDALRLVVATTTTTPGEPPRHSITRNTRSSSSSSFGRRTNGVDDSSIDSFGTPMGKNEDDKSEDSPFSTGCSISSHKAVAKRKRKITPGATLTSRANKTLKDLVPHYPRSYGLSTK